jgi:RNA polymerase sigma factor (sigma-70 family)
MNPEPILIPGTVLPVGLAKCIEEYKRTRDAQQIFWAMSSLSKLIIKMLLQEVKRYNVLQDMEMQELYNASFICLHHAMIKFDISRSTIYCFPRFLQGYIRGELKKIIRDRTRMVCCGIEATSFENIDNRCYQNAERSKSLLIVRLSIEDTIVKLAKEGKINKVDLELFKLRCIKGYPYKDIAELSGRTEKGVECRIRRMIDKIRSRLKYFKKV